MRDDQNFRSMFADRQWPTVWLESQGVVRRIIDKRNRKEVHRQIYLIKLLVLNVNA